MKPSALALMLMASPAFAQVAFIPCDYAVPVHPSALERIASSPAFRARPRAKAKVTHRGRALHGKRRPLGAGGRRGFHLALARDLCPIWADDPGLGGPAGFEPFAGDWLPIDAADTDLGSPSPFMGEGWDGGIGGAGDLPWSPLPAPSPILIVDASPPLAPPPSLPHPGRACARPGASLCGGGPGWGEHPPHITPIPEPSTWALLAIGFAAVAGFGLKRRRA